VGIVNTKRDLQILEQERWYRVPDDVKLVRKELWPPQWFAAFETVTTSASSQQVARYARVEGIELKSREELFPGEPAGMRSGRLYQQLRLGPIQALPEPLRPQRPRRTPFIQTTFEKLVTAEQFNDLFDDSPFEDRLWEALKKNNMEAERQWSVASDDGNFLLDFALFCRNRPIDVEVDGRPHHAVEKRSISDAARDRALAGKGWSVVRFRTTEIAQRLNYCMSRLSSTIVKCGGLDRATVVLQTKSEPASQLALLESRFTYDEGFDDA